MSRTRRIYNRRHLKKTHRLNLEELPPGLANMTDDERMAYINDPLKYSVHQYGFFYTPYRHICMGRCPYCRDHSMNQRIQRKRRKMEFKRMLSEEME